MLNSQEVLKKIGLSKNEIETYIAGLKLGPSLASEISFKTKLNRTLVYHLLGSLGEKGLVKKTNSRYGKVFVMEGPESIQNILERKSAELKKTKEQFASVSAELNSLQSPKTKLPQVVFYEGAEGLKNIAQATLECEGDDVCALIPIDKVPEAFNKEFMEYWVEETNKRNIKRRSIWTKPLNKTSFTGSKLRELRISPKESDIRAFIIIYGTKTAVISSSKDFFGFIIDSEEYASTMRSLFESIWKISAPSK